MEALLSDDEGGAATRAAGTIVSDERAIQYHLEAGDNWRWNALDPLGTSVTVTYSFFEGADLPTTAEYNPYGADSYSAFTEAQRANFRLAAAEFMAVSGLIFVEVEGDGMIDIFNASGTNVGGWAGIPWVSEGYEPDIKLVIDGTGSYAQDTYGYYTLVHELGHAVGLDHTFASAYQLESELDTTANSVMSDNYDASATGLQWMDVAALQAIYGTPVSSETVSYVYVEQANKLIAEGTEDDDTLSVSSGIKKARLNGGGGNDDLNGNDSTDVLRGGDGTDDLDGGAGRDFLRGGRGDDTLRGGDGNDYLNGGSGADTLFGGDGADVLDGRTGGDRLMGEDGRDQLFGWRGDDVLNGGADDDVLQGGWGSDSLTGGTGADRFVFTALDGADRITDFERGVDVIDLTALGTSFSALELSTTAGVALIEIGDLAIRLEGVTATSLDAGDFMF